MKILVLSDTHGSVRDAEEAVAREKPDRIFHLGDGWRDAQRLGELHPEIPLIQVPGNCDFIYGVAAERLLILEGRRILLCHGHTYQVKSSLLTAAFAAEEKGLDAFLFGHTHRPLVDWRGRTLFINPGSMSRGGRQTYAILTVEPEKLDARIVPFDTDL